MANQCLLMAALMGRSSVEAMLRGMGIGQGQYRGKFERHGQAHCRGKVVGHGQGQYWGKDEGQGQEQ